MEKKKFIMCQKIPDLYDIDVNPRNKEWTEYNKAIRDVGVDFKVPEDYFFEYPMNGDTKDIVAKAKAQIKEIEKGSPKLEMKKEDKGREMEQIFFIKGDKTNEKI